MSSVFKFRFPVDSEVPRYATAGRNDFENMTDSYTNNVTRTFLALMC